MSAYFHGHIMILAVVQSDFCRFGRTFGSSKKQTLVVCVRCSGGGSRGVGGEAQAERGPITITMAAMVSQRVHLAQSLARTRLLSLPQHAVTIVP